MTKKNNLIEEVERVQTGVRLEKKLLKVLKALADLKDMSLGDLIEGIVLHTFDGKLPFGDETRKQIHELKKVFNMDLNASSSHRLSEVRKSKKKEGHKEKG